MKTISYILLSSAILFSLAGCKKSGSLTQEEFINKTSELNSEHSFKSAKLIASIDDPPIKESCYATFIYENNSFIVQEDTLPNSYDSFVGLISRFTAQWFAKELPDMNVKWSLKEKGKSLCASYEANTSSKNNGITRRIRIYRYASWEEHGLVTSYIDKREEKETNGMATVTSGYKYDIGVTYK